MKKCKLLLCTSLVVTLSLTACNSESNSAKSFNKKGTNYYEASMYEEAKDNFSKAIDANPNRAEYYINYGMTLIELEEYDVALDQFEQVIILKDTKITRENNKKAYRGKGIAYLMDEQYQLAINQFDLALEIKEIDKINEDILFYKANAQTAIKDFESAITTYTNIIENDKTNSMAYQYRANVYINKEELELAVADYDSAIQYNKNNYDLYMGKYFLLLNSNETEKADEVLKAALNLKSRGQEDNFNRARIQFYQGDYENAFIGLSVAKESGYSEAIFYLAMLYEQQDEYDKAIDMYKEYVKVEEPKEEATACNQLAIRLMEKNEYQEALIYIQQGIKSKDKSAIRALKFNEVAAYENLAQFNKAYNKMKQYVEEYPEDEQAIRELTFLETRR